MVSPGKLVSMNQTEASRGRGMELARTSGVTSS